MPGEEGPELDMTQDIARDIGQSVEIMILDAKHNSETKVAKEIQKLKSKMDQMNAKIRMVSERVNRMEPDSKGLVKSDLQKSIAKLEEVWEGEVGALKHELWQTIQAHNHNADLLKHHKEGIDEVQSTLTDTATPSAALEPVHAQIAHLDKLLQRELAKEVQVDQLMRRLALVQQQLAAAMGGWPASAGVPPFSLAGGAAAAKKAAKAGAQGKAKAGKAPKAAGLGQMPNLRAEAPEFVPTGG